MVPLTQMARGTEVKEGWIWRWVSVCVLKANKEWAE